MSALEAVPLPREGRHQVKVYYEDTDALGVVYYANYLKFMERGRTELFASAGASVREWNEAGVNIAVFKANMTFLAPARLGDVLSVLTRREEAKSPFRMPLHQEVWRGDTKLTEAKIQLVCVDASFALQEFPTAWLA